MGSDERAAVCAQVYRKHPAMNGVRPSVQKRGANRVYTFRKRVPTAPGGPQIDQVVRATVDSGGRIVKLVASR